MQLYQIFFSGGSRHYFLDIQYNGTQQQYGTIQEGIVYFADDDNTYDYRLFREISRTNRISMFPVGFIGGQGVSAPIVKEGEVVGFTDDWFASASGRSTWRASPSGYLSSNPG